MERYPRNKTIDSILEVYRDVLEKDFSIYKNHVYRIYYIALSLDHRDENKEKYAIAAAYHDLGIWTHSFDYLEPSIEMAKQYLLGIGKSNWSEEIALMIDNHHKLSSYNGENLTTVETFRKADWVDVVKGVKMFGVNKSIFLGIKNKFPIAGFHWFLVKQSVKYFFKNPKKPLPMFKK